MSNHPAVEALEDRRLMAAGDDFRVNAVTDGLQGAPQVATNGDGQTLVVWRSDQSRAQQGGLYAQRYDAAGRTVNGQVDLGIPERFFDEGFEHDLGAHAVAMDADGDFVVLYSSTTFAGDIQVQGPLIARRYDASGAGRGGPIRVSEDGFGEDVAMDADGDFLVTYSLGGPDWVGQRFSASRERLGEPVTFDDPRYANHASLAMAPDGRFVVAWETSVPEGEVRAQRFDATGRSQGPSFVVSGERGLYDDAPAVEMNRRGEFIIAWGSARGEDNWGVYARRYDAEGNPRTGEFRLPGFTDLVLDDAGNTIVAFDRFTDEDPATGTYDVYAQRFDPAGVAVGDVFAVNVGTGGSQRSVSIAVDAAATATFAWHSSEDLGITGDVYARRFTFRLPPEAPPPLPPAPVPGPEPQPEPEPEPEPPPAPEPEPPLPVPADPAPPPPWAGSDSVPTPVEEPPAAPVATPAVTVEITFSAWTRKSSGGGRAKGRVSVALRLAGAGSLKARVPTVVFLSADETLDATDARLTAAAPKLRLRSGQRKVVNLKWSRLPELPEGSYWLIIQTQDPAAGSVSTLAPTPVHVGASRAKLSATSTTL